MRCYQNNRDVEWTSNQTMTNEKKFSRFLLEIEYTASTDYPEYFRDPFKAIWILKIITNHCPTCGHQLEEGDERGTMTLGFKNDKKEYREVIKYLKKYLEDNSFDLWYDFPNSNLRDFEFESKGSDVITLDIQTKHPNCPKGTMEFENKKEIEDLLNFLKSELNEAKNLEEEEYPRIKKWHDDNQKQREAAEKA